MDAAARKIIVAAVVAAVVADDDSQTETGQTARYVRPLFRGPKPSKNSSLPDGRHSFGSKRKVTTIFYLANR
jgi:hypothetical protein